MEHSASDLPSQWLQALQNDGCRITHARRAIVNLLIQSDRALGPIEIYDLARKEYSALGLVTVYRTLEKLEELGLIQRVHMPDGCHRYLKSAQGHEHLLLCTKCGKTVTFRGDDLNQLSLNVSQKTGFVIQDHWLQLFGLCPKCQENT